MRFKPIIVVSVSAVVIALSLQPAWAQWVVNDPGTTARNTVTAVLKRSLLETLNLERERLRRMSVRLSALTSLRKYAMEEVPRWRTHAWDTETFPYAAGYHAALNYGDAGGSEYFRVARSRQAADAALLAQLPPGARDAVAGALATIDAADSMLVASTHQTGSLRFNGRRELAAIEALESHVIDPSNEQSMTAVLDKISGAVLLETGQKQARIQLLAAVAEQLIVENRRSRDAEAAALNMQLGRLRDGRAANSSLLDGAGADLRAWRQP
jgi:hypothetical protein